MSETSIQRYMMGIAQRFGLSTHFIEPIKISDGEWVRWRDIEAKLALLAECERAGFVKEGKVRKVLGTLPVTKDGAIVGHGGEVWVGGCNGSPPVPCAVTVQNDIDPSQCNGPYVAWGEPDHVIAFPGGKGTENMVGISRATGIPTTTYWRTQ